MKKIVEVIISMLLVSLVILSTFSVSSSGNTNIRNDFNIMKIKHFGINNLRSYLLERVNNYRNNYLNKIEKTNGHAFNVLSDWSPTETVSTESTADSTWSSIATDSADTVYVVWEDDTNYMGCGSDFDIFYKTRSKGGSWTSTEVVSSESSVDLVSCLPNSIGF